MQAYSVIEMFLSFQAILHLEKGIATRDDIDKTLRLGMGHPMGPLTLGAFLYLTFELSISFGSAC